MNIHPFIVHVPVAFLSVYGFMELVRFRFITSRVYWFYIKAFLVIIGSLGSVVAYKSGEIAEELIGESQIVEMHSHWAKISVVLFGLITILYVLAWISRLEITSRIENYLKLNESKMYTILKGLINYLVGSFVMALPAMAGLVSIVITGALGGAIVYGPDIDPFVRTIHDFILN